MNNAVKISADQATFPTLQQAVGLTKDHKELKVKQVKDKKQRTDEDLQNKTDNTAQAKLSHSLDAKHQPTSMKIEQTSNITTLVSDEVQKLLNLLNDLSPDAQNQYEITLRNKQSFIAGFQSLFASNNSKYLSAKDQMNNADVREKFWKIREEEKTQHKTICLSYENTFKKIFEDRITALQQAIANHSLESALLKESIIGNDSYSKSFSLFNMEIGYLYGLQFRLWEALEALKTRKIAVGIKEEETSNLKNGEKAPLESSMIGSSKSSEFYLKIVRLSHDLVALKEEVTICNEALRKDIYEIAVSSDLPRKYYIYHKQRLDALKQTIEEVKEEFPNQIELLDKNIMLEASTPDSPKSIAWKQEHLEITKRLDMIKLRQNEIDDFLAHRKKIFGLEEKNLDPKEPIQLTDLSTDYQQALKLIQSITTLKEDIVLSNQWENIDPLDKRRMTYFHIATQIKDLENEKKIFESNVLPNRLKIIDAAIATYKTYISNIQESTKAIDNHFKLLGQDAQQRAKWRVTAKTEALSTSQTTMGFFNISSWFPSTANIEKGSEKKTEGQQESAQATASDEKTDEKFEKKETKEDHKEI